MRLMILMIALKVMVLLIKQRLKKHTSTLFLSCLRELCVAHPENLTTILKHTIFNELSQSRNPNNMQLLGVMFQVGDVSLLFLSLTSLSLFRSTKRRPPLPWPMSSWSCCFKKIVISEL